MEMNNYTPAALIVKDIKTKAQTFGATVTVNSTELTASVKTKVIPPQN